MKRRRRLAFAGLTAAVLLLAGHLAACGVLSPHRLRTGFAEWVAQAGNQGWTITTGAMRLEGWPLAAEVAVPDLHAVGGASAIPGGADWWQVPVLTLGVSFRHPTTLRISASGAQTLRLGGLPAISYTADLLTAEELALDPSARRQRARDFMAVRLRTSLLPSGEMEVAQIRGRMDASTGGLELTADRVDLPPPWPGGAWALGDRIGQIVLNMQMKGRMPALPDAASQARAWRDSGGEVTVRRLDLRWGRLHLDATATLGLDAALQPAGQANARLVDPAGTVDAPGGRRRPAGGDGARAVESGC